VLDLIDGQPDVVDDLAAGSDNGHVERRPLVDRYSRRTDFLDITNDPKALGTVFRIGQHAEDWVVKLVNELGEIPPAIRFDCGLIGGTSGTHIASETGLSAALSPFSSIHDSYPFEEITPLFYIHLFGSLIVVAGQDLPRNVHPVGEYLLGDVLSKEVRDRPSPDRVR
jgi:hypothetical protein